MPFLQLAQLRQQHVGAGFAPFRGGPIQYIRETGADALLAKLRDLQSRHGERFAPRPGWDAPSLR